MAVYYVSKALNDAEGRYLEVEKYTYEIIIVARKLRKYFQAHTIKVLTDKPLRQVLTKPNTSGRLVKWSIKLGKYDVKYEARPTIKSQILAEFMGDNTPTNHIREEEDSSESEESKKSM
ncbi:hypothetical protein CFOL_v3_18012 [Cephalotus follicularis]|uniref:Reverse transcriptase RNase H-like domain-containing protein n=1 Tax=Cephalotus follicularis TaxID=3775 RepID=A0A1Q3C345_CEPFO|nr:hypothetical protein CFOL_v3_18012 [Cephalotus follicularis]